MSVLVLKDASVTINGVDLSDHVTSVTINYSAEILDKTAMGANSKSKVAGLKDASAEIEFNQDFAAAKVDATLFPLVGAAAFPVIIKPTSGATSETNPAFTGNGLLESYPPLGGGVGEVAKTSATIQIDGDLTRAIV